MSAKRHERPDGETPAGREMGIWERRVRAIMPEDGGPAAELAPDGERVTAERMRELLGSDTPPERPGH